MIQFDSGKRTDSGQIIYANIDENIAPMLRNTIKRNFRNWDYKAIGVGFSGTGKSTGTRQFGNYIKHILKKDHNIDVKVYVVFSAEEMEAVATTAQKYSIIILDECFADMNSSVSRSKDYQKIINLMQIIRQRGYFLFLNLPNFFDLSKSVALFQTNHLFVFETDENDYRGRIRVFDRDRKQALYLKGKKELNYYAHRPNYLARFYKDEKAMDNESYEKKKTEHFLNLNKNLEKLTPKSERNDVMFKLHRDYGFKVTELMKLAGLKSRQVYTILENYK